MHPICAVLVAFEPYFRVQNTVHSHYISYVFIVHVTDVNTAQFYFPAGFLATGNGQTGE